MNAEMSIPSCVEAMAASEVAEVATQALKEAHGNMYDFKKTPLKFALK